MAGETGTSLPGGWLWPRATVADLQAERGDVDGLLLAFAAVAACCLLIGLLIGHAL